MVPMFRRHRRLSALVLMIASAGLVTSCGLIKNRSDDYLKSQELPPIVVPEDLDSEALGQIYSVPPTDQVPESDEFEVPRPQSISDNVFEETVKIQSYAGEQWILINKPPGEIWPRVRNILTRSGVAAEKVDASHGTIETAWIQFKNDETTSHRFLFNIEPAIQIDSTEIKIRQMQAPKGSEDSTLPWPQTSQNADREKEMVDIISQSMASDISGAGVSLLAQNIGGVEKVRIITPRSADPYIQIALIYDRAWASVSYSLSRGGFAIESSEQESGRIDVSYLPDRLDDEKPGFFARMFGLAQEKTPVYYKVNVRQASGAVEVRITDSEGASLTQDHSSRLLKIIRSNLS